MDPLYKMLDLDLNEKVILRIHPHWFVFLKKVLIFLLEAIVPILIYLILVNFFPEVLSEERYTTLLFLGASLYYFFIWTILFYNWLDYYLDFWVVTNKQIIAISQCGLWNRKVIRQPLYNLQDTIAESKGFWATLFHFGDVKIQSAGPENLIIFSQIPNPFEIAAKINDLVKYSPKEVLKK
jgi:hypothetical protein